jgi:hypothetical protein
MLFDGDRFPIADGEEVVPHQAGGRHLALMGQIKEECS